MAINGITDRDRNVNINKRAIRRHVLENPSVKKTYVNGQYQPLVINTGTQPYYKEYETLPGDIIHPGDIIRWEDLNTITHWLVKTADYDTEMYIDGKLEQCNWLLRWQNENGQIIERWVVKSNASSYNSGIEGDSVMKLGYDQALVLIPLDSETIKLRRGKRFFIDNNEQKPVPFTITRPDTVSFVYEGYGYLNMIMSEDQVINGKDNIELQICDYRPPYDFDKPVAKKTSHIMSSDNILVNGSKHGLLLKAIFFDEDDRDDEAKPIWNLVGDASEFVEMTKLEDGSITLYCDNNDAISMMFKVTLVDENSLYKEDSMVIKIESSY